MIGNVFFTGKSNRMLHSALSYTSHVCVIPFSAFPMAKRKRVCEKTFPLMCTNEYSENCKRRELEKFFFSVCVCVCVCECVLFFHSSFFCIINKINFLYVHFSLSFLRSVTMFAGVCVCVHVYVVVYLCVTVVHKRLLYTHTMLMMMGEYMSFSFRIFFFLAFSLISSHPHLMILWVRVFLQIAWKDSVHICFPLPLPLHLSFYIQQQ